MEDGNTRGVLIGDKLNFVRLTRNGERRADEGGMSTAIIDVQGGPFSGTVRTKRGHNTNFRRHLMISAAAGQ